MIKPPFVRRALLAALFPIVIAGCSPPSGISSAQADNRAQAAMVASARALPDFSALAEQQGATVVNIATTQKIRTAAMLPPGMDPNDPMAELFRRFQGQQGRQGPQAPPSHAIGSGFIVSSDGYVLTNTHVVKDAVEVTVKLTDGREFQAKVIGSDSKTDVALIKIDATGLPVVRIGDSAKTRVGEWVAAMGSPFGFENTITAGIVSGKARSLPDDSYVPFIQTDVAVNPGNSGGPLFNMSGEVIGINSQIYSQTGGYMGLSFAIPIDVAMKVKDQLQQHGKVSRGRLGVGIQTVSKDLAESFGLKKATGALVSSVDKDGPAARAGLLPGDVILAYNGAEVEKSIDLPRLVGDTRPGQTATMRVWRKGAEISLKATLGEVPGEKVAAAEPEGVPSGKLGVAVRALSAEEKKALGKDGVLVEQAGGAAARAGIQAGDVILALNNEMVGSVEQLRKALDKTGKNVAVLVQRGDATLYVPVTFG